MFYSGITATNGQSLKYWGQSMSQNLKLDTGDEWKGYTKAQNKINKVWVFLLLAAAIVQKAYSKHTLKHSSVIKLMWLRQLTLFGKSTCYIVTHSVHNPLPHI